jgi:hypothetical protein
LRDEKVVVKTVRNADWTAFLDKFAPSAEKGGVHEHHPAHRSVGPGPAIGHKLTEDNKDYPFNSFVTSTSLLYVINKSIKQLSRCLSSQTSPCKSLPQPVAWKENAMLWIH